MRLDDSQGRSIGIGLQVLRFAGKVKRLTQALEDSAEPGPEPEPEPEPELELEPEPQLTPEDSPSLNASMAAMRFAGKAKRKIQVKAEERRKKGQNSRDAVSVDKQKEIVEQQLESLDETTDLHAIMTTLKAARFLSQKHAATGIDEAAKMVEERMRKQNPQLGRKMDLRNSSAVKVQIRRLWDLLLTESSTSFGDARGVSAFAYYELHCCISRAVSDEAEFWSLDEAVDVAKTDWVEDVAKFSSDSTINAWFVKVKQAITQKSEQLVQLKGWQRVFQKIDLDGSGSLDFDEFTKALRASGVHRGVADDFALQMAFESADTNHSGELDAEEFVRWLQMSDTQEGEQRAVDGVLTRRSKQKLAVLECVRAIRNASADQVSAYGWTDLFASFDTDNSGSLECQEFIVALRAKCGMRHDEVEDHDLREVFSIIDTDNSGSISATEFSKSLRKNETEGYTMTYDAFEGSMYELVDYWSHGTTAMDYVLFFKALFRMIAMPQEGVVGHDAAVLTELPRVSTSRGDAEAQKPRVNYRIRLPESVKPSVKNGRFDLGDLTPEHERRAQAAVAIQALVRGRQVRQVKERRKRKKRTAKEKVKAKEKKPTKARPRSQRDKNRSDVNPAKDDRQAVLAGATEFHAGGASDTTDGSNVLSSTPTRANATDQLPRSQTHMMATTSSVDNGEKMFVASTPENLPQPQSALTPKPLPGDLPPPQSALTLKPLPSQTVLALEALQPPLPTTATDHPELATNEGSNLPVQRLRSALKIPRPPQNRRKRAEPTTTTRCRRYGPPVQFALRRPQQPAVRIGSAPAQASFHNWVPPLPLAGSQSLKKQPTTRPPARATSKLPTCTAQRFARAATARTATAPWPHNPIASPGHRARTASSRNLLTGHVYNIQGVDLTCGRNGGKVYSSSGGAWYSMRGQHGSQGHLSTSKLRSCRQPAPLEDLFLLDKLLRERRQFEKTRRS